MKFFIGYFVGGVLCSYSLLYLLKRGVNFVWFMYSIISSRNWVVAWYIWSLFNLYVY